MYISLLERQSNSPPKAQSHPKISNSPCRFLCSPQRLNRAQNEKRISPFRQSLPFRPTVFPTAPRHTAIPLEPTAARTYQKGLTFKPSIRQPTTSKSSSRLPNPPFAAEAIHSFSTERSLPTWFSRVFLSTLRIVQHTNLVVHCSSLSLNVRSNHKITSNRPDRDFQ